MHVDGIPAGESDDALANNLANFLHTLALSEAAGHWSMTTLRGRLVKIGARIVGQGRSITFQWPRSWCRAACSRKSAPP